jgi:hypothetical protein
VAGRNEISLLIYSAGVRDVHTVLSDNITVRLNNRHRAKASLLHSAVFMAVLPGISMMSLIVGMTLFFARNKDNAKL